MAVCDLQRRRDVGIRFASLIYRRRVMPGTATIHEFLREAHVPYTVVPHPPAFTAQEEAQAAQVAGRDWAKVVACFIDGEAVEAVVPAPSFVKLDRLLELAGGNEARVADEGELR